MHARRLGAVSITVLLADRGDAGHSRSAARQARIPLKKEFIADLVAAGLPFARTDAVDEWLQVALALSIEIFLGESPRSFRNRGRLGCLNGSIRG